MSERPSERTPDALAPPHPVQRWVYGVGDVPLSVRVRRGSRDIPVLLVHGFGSSAEANWNLTGWLRTLGRAGLTTVTVDLRGHGRSGKPLDSYAYSLPIVLTDLELVLADLPSLLGPAPAVDVVGYSMGGRLVGELVASSTGSLRYPERTPWASGLPSIRRAVIGGYDGRPLFDSVEFTAFTAALAAPADGAGPGPHTRGGRVAAIARADPDNDLDALTALVQGLSRNADPLPAEAVEVPTLVVAGDRDAITDGTLRWAERLPRGRHLLLPGRNHISAVPSGVFRAAAADFLTADF